MTLTQQDRDKIRQNKRQNTRTKDKNIIERWPQSAGLHSATSGNKNDWEWTTGRHSTWEPKTRTETRQGKTKDKGKTQTRHTRRQTPFFRLSCLTYFQIKFVINRVIMEKWFECSQIVTLQRMTKTKNINPWNGKAASIQGGDEIFLLENKAVDVIWWLFTLITSM